MVAVLMSHLLGADASNTNVDAIYFPTANGADGADGANGCRQDTPCGGIKVLTITSHFFDL
jgi:hypothetical protein|tara:strand:+ start:524 stop:706 length:183 start_codon:yes stop_codon:yes gene_type:complete